MTTSREAPYPPIELATRVLTVTGFSSDPFLAYEEMGAQTRTAIERLLPDDWSWEGKRSLDFGCGAGRTMRQFLPEAETAEFWGTDIDGPSIEWLDANLCPPLHAWKAEIGPPSGLPHGSFDLIWSISVFTHLTDNSSRWLLELQRLLKPGGILIATYMKGRNYEFFTGEPWDEERVGRTAIYDSNPWDKGGPAVFMSDWWVREHWGRAFEIEQIAPEIHDMSWAVMRKREVELTTEELDRPADYPREYAALADNLRLLRKEIHQAEQRHAEELERLRDGYERSASRRISRGLRRLGQRSR